jgi:aryl-alcohol dehydrogenase-like predicted oxidoreductase
VRPWTRLQDYGALIVGVYAALSPIWVNTTGERGARDRIVLASKVGARPEQPGLGLEAAEGLSAKAIHAAIDGSLRRLGTDSVDVYYAHIEDRSVPLEETTGTLAELVADGKAGELGCSNHATSRIERARAVARGRGWPVYTCI